MGFTRGEKSRGAIEDRSRLSTLLSSNGGKVKLSGDLSGADGQSGVVLTGKSEDVIVDDAMGEPYFAIDEVIDPLSPEDVDLLLACLLG